MFQHQYIHRKTSQIITEKLIQDRSIQFLYHQVREHAPTVFNVLTSNRVSGLLAFFNYDFSLLMQNEHVLSSARAMGIDLQEFLDDPKSMDSMRKLFERKIRYWETRPMSTDIHTVVSPSDSRILIGSLVENNMFFIKEKFFTLVELLGDDQWVKYFQKGDIAIFRLTPDKYHYNHAPVSGKVVDVYSFDGKYHSCNPEAVLAMVTPYSKNKRVVTIIDTDVDGGTQVGKVAMIEVVAMMIGQIVQCYSDHHYENPQEINKNAFLQKGQPKSLYRPGSSTNVLLFEPERIVFDSDLIQNQKNHMVSSRFTKKWGIPLVETDLQVRSQIACKL